MKIKKTFEHFYIQEIIHFGVLALELNLDSGFDASKGAIRGVTSRYRGVNGAK